MTISSCRKFSLKAPAQAPLNRCEFRHHNLDGWDMSCWFSPLRHRPWPGVRQSLSPPNFPRALVRKNACYFLPLQISFIAVDDMHRGFCLANAA